MEIIISIAIWTLGSALTILLFFVELFFAVILFPFDKKRKVVHAQCFWWANALIGLNPYWNFRLQGLENIDRKKTYVIVANHQSIADIIVIYKTRMQFKWVAKESLFKIPFVGWCLSLGKHIRLKRGKFASIKNVYSAAAAWLRKDVSVLFFPEGTRSKTGKMNGFQNGAFRLAIKEKKSILPIAIKGTREVITKGSWIFKTRVSATLTILPPIATDNLCASDFIYLKDTVYTTLKKHFAVCSSLS